MKLSEAWVAILRDVSSSGTPINDLTGDYLELPMLQIDISEFDSDGSLITNHVPIANINEMRKVFVEGGENIFGHEYVSLMAQGDQIGRIVKQLLHKPVSRKAVIALGLVPDVEWVPCINTMHFWIRDGLLHLHYFSRGQDLWTKFVPDILAMRVLQSNLAAKLGVTVSPGLIRGVISSAHIYTRDIPNVHKLLRDASL